jgi:Fur family ferric uptake transcriptional regulator
MNLRNDVKEKMKLGGHRTSATREVLIDVLQKAKKPLAVPELLLLLEKRKTLVNKTTIYREIEKLINHQVVKEIYFGNDKARYELADGDHHHHIICVECKRVDDVAATKDVQLQEKDIAKTLNYKVLDHSLEFFGVCKSCQN